MNGRWMPFCLAVVLVLGLPRLVYGYLTLNKDKNEETETEYAQPSSATERTTIKVLSGNDLKEMDLEEYLVGVLLCEMPGQFHIEAQKSQAVVARTYALRTILYKQKHEANAICTDPGCCQGYRDPAEYLASGGDENRIEVARCAVTQTHRQVLTYKETLIDATYFSCSGGQTEDALAVWGVDIPYLQSVPSPGEEDAAYYWDTITFTPESFQKALGQKLYGASTDWFGRTTYTRGGGVESMVIGGKMYTGTSLRTLLGLRSTAFSVSASESNIVITTRGFGHRVGMSQYGAQSMALSGKEYPEILTHYYPGAVIDKADYIG